jgi:hypothetical protein
LPTTVIGKWITKAVAIFGGHSEIWGLWLALVLGCEGSNASLYQIDNYQPEGFVRDDLFELVLGRSGASR